MGSVFTHLGLNEAIKVLDKTLPYYDKGFQLCFTAFLGDEINTYAKLQGLSYDFYWIVVLTTKWIKKIWDWNIEIRAFFAPNHIYDENTFLALKTLGIKQVIDGYGLFPYEENGIIFTPQLFYENIFIPFGLQSTQIHLNTWTDQDFINFKNFIEQKQNKIISYDQMLKNINNNFVSRASRFLISKILKVKRSMYNN